MASRAPTTARSQDNAFYCPDGDFIAFDDAALFPQLESRFGRYTVATVLAHEWGHAIQHRRGYSLSGVLTELQADCFSGAWMGHVRSGGAPQLQLSDTDLRRAITGILEFRDDPGTSAQEQGAHGSAFDRLGSFQDGLEGGPTACDAYSVSPPVVLELPFESQADAQTPGQPAPRHAGPRRAEGPRPVLGVGAAAVGGHVPRAQRLGQELRRRRPVPVAAPA